MDFRLVLGQFDDALAITIVSLKEALDDTDAVVQLQAANALYLVANSAKLAKSAVPNLKKLAMSADGKLRSAAYLPASNVLTVETNE